MPRLPLVSGKDVVAALQRLGFSKVRQSGSHVIMRKDSVGCSVPMHREIKRGTLGAIVEQAEITPDTLIEALRK